MSPTWCHLPHCVVFVPAGVLMFVRAAGNFDSKRGVPARLVVVVVVVVVKVHVEGWQLYGMSR